MHECELSCGNYIREEEKYCKECMEYEKRNFKRYYMNILMMKK